MKSLQDHNKNNKREQERRMLWPAPSKNAVHKKYCLLFCFASLVLCFPFLSFPMDRYYPCLSMDYSMSSRLPAVYIPLLCSIDFKATETDKSPFQRHLVRNRSIYDHCRNISPSHSFKHDLFCSLMSYEIPFTLICDSGSFRFLSAAESHMLQWGVFLDLFVIS
jgi:hypothetical protein